MTSASPYLRARSVLLVVLLVIVATHGAQGRARPGHPASKRDAKHEIEAMEEQWRVAQLSADISTMDTLLADDFVGISITGQANNKSQQLDRYRRRTLVLTRIDLDDRKIKLVGNIAVVTSLAQVEGTNEGESMKGTYRYTRVYQRVAPGVWKTTNFEATRVPQPH